MQYLITFKDETHPPFLTKWFDKENHWSDGMIVYDLVNNKWTRNGEDWMGIVEDHL
jgi:hypothetical protein